jgi:hypothetical protein
VGEAAHHAGTAAALGTATNASASGRPS